MSLSVSSAARIAAESLALVFAQDGQTVTFGELAAQVHGAAEPAALLEAAARPDALLQLYTALERHAGALLVDPRLGPRERAALMARTERDTLVVFTSGSTGAPKGVVLGRAALAAAATAQSARLELCRGDRWLLCLPWSHVGGLMVLLRALSRRATVVVAPPAPFRVAPMLELFERHAVTHVSLVPTQLARLIDAPPPATLRVALVGGAPCPPALLAEARARGWPARASYGLTEACALVAVPHESGAAATLVDGMQARIEADGRIALRGPQLFSGYLGQPAHAPGAWFVTSDLGELDGDGGLRVLGRADDVIISGGEKVAPAEVETALTLHPGIRAACVFGVPDDSWGSAVAAVIEPSGPPLSDAALRQHLAPLLAAYKQPRLVAWRDDTAGPGVGLGKVTSAQRRDASARYRAHLQPLV